MMASEGTVVIDPPDGSMRDYLAQLARLRALGPEVAVPAHGAPIDDAVARIDGYVAHRLWRERSVTRGDGLVRTTSPRTYSFGEASGPTGVGLRCRSR